MSGTLVEGFTELNDITSIYRSDQSGQPITTSGPCLIVYCSWMGAAAKHIAKYTNGYRRLFPDASILLIQSTLQNMFVGSDLTAAREVVNSFIKLSNGNDPYIVLHACSNGGARNATWMAERLLETHSSLPFRSLILDCCPGKGDPKTATEAVSLSLPKQRLVRIVGSWALYAAFTAMMVIYTILGWEDSVTEIRRKLNDANVFSNETPRLYVYSENDVLVKWQHVHEHAEDAKEKGYAVKEERFKKAAHVALLMEDSEKYWKAVQDHICSTRKTRQDELDVQARLSVR